MVHLALAAAAEAAAGVRGEMPNSPSSPTGTAVSYAYGVANSRYAAGYHTGVDFSAATGTPIKSVTSGVCKRYVGGAYGKGFIIDDGKHEWLYAHCSVRLVVPGQRVKVGQVIAKVGATGNTTGPHLHLEQSKGRRWAYGNVQNPQWQQSYSDSPAPPANAPAQDSTTGGFVPDASTNSIALDNLKSLFDSMSSSQFWVNLLMIVLGAILILVGVYRTAAPTNLVGKVISNV